jgi:hypothetical protein
MDILKKAVNSLMTWLVKYPFAFIATVAILTLGSVLLLTGFGKRFNFGGILGHVWGFPSTKESSRVELANSVPKDRKDSDGSLIDKGVVDENGFVQREVKVLEISKNPFRDKSLLKIQTVEGLPKTVVLPKGVLDQDVDTILQIQPEVFRVEIKEQPSFNLSDDLRGKFKT